MNHATGEAIDLSNCEREPIHVPERAQSHGMLFALSEPDLLTRRVSANVRDFLGVDAERVLGNSFLSLLEPALCDDVEAILRSPEVHHHNPIPLRMVGRDQSCAFDAIAHRHAGQLIVELEPALDARASLTDLQRRSRESIAKLRTSRDLTELCQNAAREVRRITGFDRVLVYVFDERWNGRVIAEEKREDVSSYMGLHFPASDIPRQARELYRLNWLRLIPNVEDEPSPLLGRAEGEPPLDLSFATLRSVSPIHIEYLQNMGATASMSVSLLREDRLWGLISCTHESGTRFVPFVGRTACEFLGEITSSLLAVKEANEDRDYKLRLAGVQTALLQSMAIDGDFVRGLLDHQPNLLHVTSAQGAVVYFNQRMYLTGKTPSEPQLRALFEWLATQPSGDLLVTESLPALYPAAEAYRDVACGLIASPLSRGRHNYVLWFRPEVVQSVDWGGNPYKPVAVVDGELRLHPRKSFELWKETVHLKSLPWQPAECEAATELTKAIVDIVLQKSEELAKLNTELARSNIELDAFAYAASHDLKEPLRGIHNYTSLILRELGDEHLVGESRSRMATIVKLTQRMEDLINSLLHYSHVGRMDLTMRDVDLNQVVAHAQEMLSTRIEETGTQIKLARSLPVVKGDAVLLGEVFSNLLTNAIKYNDKGDRLVEVGYEAGPPFAFYVRDNGIGIRERNLDTVFKIFRRLHARDKYGGGTGTGLTIAKRIVERHGGQMWLESEFGEGTRVWFTLGRGDARGS